MNSRIAFVIGTIAMIVTFGAAAAALFDRHAAPLQVAIEDYALMIPSTASIEMLQYMR